MELLIPLQIERVINDGIVSGDMTWACKAYFARNDRSGAVKYSVFHFQLLTNACIIVVEQRILILDETTSSVDSHLEAGNSRSITAADGGHPTL
jgi:ABC-type multidrug transport system fused ATPase/permease subunit